MLDSLVARLTAPPPAAPSPARPSPAQQLFTAIGAHRTALTADARWESNVDELYRLALGLESAGRVLFADSLGAPVATLPPDSSLGWTADRWRGGARLSAHAAEPGAHHAFVRLPDRRATIIVLSDDDALDARAVADRIAERLMARRR